MKFATSSIQRKNRQLVVMFEKLRLALEYGPDQWREILELTKKEYEKVQGRRQDVPLHSLVTVAERLNLNLESFQSGRIDFPTVAAHHSGNLSYIPEKYLIAAKSRKRTIVNALNYVDTFIGWERRLFVMRDVQIHEPALVNLNENVNLNLARDVYGSLEKAGFGKDVFFSIGAYSVITNHGSALQKELSLLDTVLDIYEQTFEKHITFFEENCKYRIFEANSSVCVVDCYPNPDVSEALRVTKLGSKNICHGKRGIMASTPQYAGLGYAEVEETKCIHDGNPYCRFVIDYSRLNRCKNKDNVLPLSQQRRASV